jgi:hypothetical protein
VAPDAFRRALRSFTRRRPFRPFQIEFHNGRRLLVSHPEAVQARGDVMYYAGPGAPGRNYLFDASSVSLLSDMEDG